MTIRDQVHLMLASTHDTPSGITFSQDGYMRAMMEDDSCAFALREKGSPTYLGMDVSISETLQGSFQIDYGGKKAGQVTVEFDASKMIGAISIYEVIGSTLTAAEVCDLIQGFLDSDDPCAWGPFEKGLHDLIRKHGRFE